MAQNDIINPADIDVLIADLSSEDGLLCQKARIALVKIGEPAVETLIKALENGDGYLHWEVIKALSQIGSPNAVQTLVGALEDSQFSIRWMAAEGLIVIGYDGLEFLLEALEKRSDSVFLREGAHHILHDLISRSMLDNITIQHVSPVLAALNGIQPAIQTPLAARQALHALKKYV